MTDTFARRRLLKAGGTALLGLAAGSAGCLSTLPPLGRKIRYGRVDVPASKPPRYRRWVPAISALQPYIDHDPLGQVIYGTPGAIGKELLDVRVGFTDTFHVSRTDYVGFDYATYDHAVTNGGAFVGEKQVDRNVVETTLEQTRYERDGTHHGYDLYTRSDVPRALAVGDEAIVNTQADSVDAARGRVTTTIDAGEGRIERRHEADPDFAALTDLTGARPFTWLGAGGIDVGDPVAGATSATFDSDAVYFIWDEVYASQAATPSQSAIKKHLETEQRPQQSMQTDIKIDGRTLSVEMRLAAEEFRNDANTETPQHITWGVDYDDDAQQLTFHHEAGDPVDTARLKIMPEYGYKGSPPFEAMNGTFGPGDSVTLELTSEAPESYRIEWHAPGGGSMSTVFDYQIEDD